MNIFFNISHPAHVHLFRNAIGILKKRHHTVLVGARNKEFCLQLLRAYKIPHVVLTRKGNGVLGLLKELMIQQVKLTALLRRHPIDLMVQMNGIFNAPVGKAFGIPTLAFSDTENDTYANFISFNLSRHLFTPTCFDTAVGGRWKNQIFYPGYHELAYLSPKYFRTPVNPEAKFLVRFVGWGAGHDLGEKSLSLNQKREIVHRLSQFGRVYISSEAALPRDLSSFQCTLPPEEIHTLMARCRMVVGESATMASEAACLGIPALYISNTGRGYTTEQAQRYGLIKHYRLNQWDRIVTTLESWADQDLYHEWQQKRRQLLKEKIDVTDWMVDLIEGYPRSLIPAKNGSFQRYRF